MWLIMKRAASRAKHATSWRCKEGNKAETLSQQESLRIQGRVWGDLLLGQSVYPVGWSVEVQKRSS